MFREPTNTNNNNIYKAKTYKSSLIMSDEEIQTRKEIEFFTIVNFFSCFILVITLIYSFIFTFNFYICLILMFTFASSTILSILIAFTPKNSKEAFGY